MSEPCDRCDDDFVAHKRVTAGDSVGARRGSVTGPACAICGAPPSYYDPVQNKYFCERHRASAVVLVKL
ncbi:MAG: hypothetical protein DRJ52_09435 [Thermoprotei archaeon]|nr:MAG: hypothetical protein DRJ52_09435 [Thermoprotei archaeon]